MKVFEMKELSQINTIVYRQLNCAVSNYEGDKKSISNIN